MAAEDPAAIIKERIDISVGLQKKTADYIAQSIGFKVMCVLNSSHHL